MKTEITAALVIFGASGDLAQRKLIPSLYKLFQKKRLPDTLDVIGFARRPYTDETFRQHLKESILSNSPEQFEESSWEEFSNRVHYFQGNLTNSDDFDKLNIYLKNNYCTSCNHYYYLATAPEFFEPIIGYLSKCGLSSEGESENKVIIEKPFGTDLKSAQKLNEFVHTCFNEDQIYRIDHYLGKETAQNILFFRFSNTFFEPVWNRNYIDHVQITVAESVDVGLRAGYYDTAGILRDMFQNHLFQLVTLTAMEPPSSFNAASLRNEKMKVLQAIRPIDLNDVILGQYDGYCQEDGVASDSKIPTYAAMKLFIDNWRWQGVPFYLRSGKALSKKTSEITIYFRKPPHNMFNFMGDFQSSPNTLSIIIQPNEGIRLSFETKQPDSYQSTQTVNMNFYYRDHFGDEPLPDAYERLLLDALHQDASLFARVDEIEQAWKLIDPVIQYSEDPKSPVPLQYTKGTWGPKKALDLIEPNGGCWFITQETGGICTI